MAEETVASRRVEMPVLPLPLSKRIAVWWQRGWRPAGTAVAVSLALLLGWHVVNGKHGLSVWHQMRSQDRELQQEIQDLQQENATLRKQIEGLKSDPDAIERKAREELHYARPGEVIYKLDERQQAPAGK